MSQQKWARGPSPRAFDVLSGNPALGYGSQGAMHPADVVMEREHGERSRAFLNGLELLPDQGTRLTSVGFRRSHTIAAS